MPYPTIPAISGLLYYLFSHPRSHFLALTPSNLARPTLSLLKWVFGLSLTHYLSSELTYFARNNWTFSDKSRWNWKEEIAVVTGGCSGIGEEVVKSLAKRGVKVVILDVTPLPERLEGGESERDLISVNLNTQP